MENANLKSDESSFRVPNSIIQGLTTGTATALNKLKAFDTVTLLGLLTQVKVKEPQKEVRTTVSELLEIIEVSKNVAHAIEREWETADGKIHRRQYEYLRYNPKQMRNVHQALLGLYEQSVVIRRRDGKSGRRLEDRTVHVLDSFGYAYESNGKTLDWDNLPSGAEKTNVGTKERPVWRVRRHTSDGLLLDHPTGILFRINAELANELAGKRGTIHFTVIARKVFSLLKQFMRCPPAIRLTLLIMRQTEVTFNRKLRLMIEDLGFDPTHPQRAGEELIVVLTRLKAVKLIKDFDVDFQNDSMRVDPNRNWNC